METDPAVSGRWGPSVVLLPTADVASALDRCTGEALAAAGPGHWATGSLGAAHVTVRALGHWGDSASDEQIDALRRAAGGPVTLAVRGLTLTSTAILARANDVDGAADALRARFAAELGAAGWLEDAVLPSGRDGWYATLVHFAAPTAEGLPAWVAERS